MKARRTATAACFMALLCTALQAADLEAGKAKVQAVCAACHGANGVSVADAIPNLAGQRVAYLEAQLKALKDGSRKNPIMNAMAAQLGNEDIANVAAFFGSLPAGSGKSDFLAAVNKTRMVFPDGYRSSCTMASSCPISCCSTPARHATPAVARTSPTC